MKLWQKISIDWPCALGDWLWAVLVMAPARFLDRLTWRLAFRLIIWLAGLYVLTLFIQHAFPLVAQAAAEVAARDLGFLFTLDGMLYWETFAAVMMLTARSHAGQIVGAAIRFIAQRVRGLASRLPRFGRRARRTRPPVRHIPDRSEDEGLWAFA